MSYRVKIIKSAEAAILVQARYIAVTERAPLNAERWLGDLFDAATTLSNWPRRCPEARESEHRPYEIRNLIVGDSVLLFTIVEETKTVWIIGFRHGGQLSRESDLPEQTPTEK